MRVFNVGAGPRDEREFKNGPEGVSKSHTRDSELFLLVEVVTVHAEQVVRGDVVGEPATDALGKDGGIPSGKMAA
jgi:hypothetical protein